MAASAIGLPNEADVDIQTEFRPCTVSGQHWQPVTRGKRQASPITERYAEAFRPRGQRARLFGKFAVEIDDVDRCNRKRRASRIQ